MKTSIVFLSFLATVLSAPHLHRRAANLQPFTGALAGISATPVENSGDATRPFKVKADTFVNLSAALARSCDQQFNACANKANSGDKNVTVAACSTQQGQCDAASAEAKAPEGSAGGQNATAKEDGNKKAHRSETAATGSRKLFDA